MKKIKNLIKNIIKRDLYLIFFCLPSLFVGFIGLNRFYDSTPDQDFIWVSQSLRILKGLGPSYGDHPGAYWPLSFLFKFIVISGNNISNYIDQNGAGSIEIIKRVIYSSRIENSIITSLIPIIFFLLLREFRINKGISILTTYCLCLSSATLNMANDIRHENIGILFMLFFILFNSRILTKKKIANFIDKKNILISSFLFYASIFCKQQILILFPLIFLSILKLVRIKSNEYYRQLIEITKNEKISNLLLLILLASIPWIISSSEEFTKFGYFYLINLPFWSIINFGFIFITIVCAQEKINKVNILKNYFIFSVIQILIFEIIAPNIWRRSVSAFPAFLFYFSSLSEDHKFVDILNNLLNLLKRYSFDLSWPNYLFIIIFFLLTLFALFRIVNVSMKQKSGYLSDYSIISCLVVITILSLRNQNFYQIYIFIPILFLISISINNKKRLWDSINKISFKKNYLFLISLILLFSFSIKSTMNLFYLNNFVSNIQNQKVVCNPQTLDYSLKNTSAGKCEEFEVESFKKKKFDQWW